MNLDGEFQPWLDHPIRSECNQAGIWRLLGGGCALLAVAFAAAVPVFASDLVASGAPIVWAVLFLSLAAIFGGVAWAFLVLRPRHLRRISWIADTAPKLSLQGRTRWRGSSVALRVADEAGIDLGALRFNPIEALDLPDHLPPKFTAPAQIRDRSGKATVVLLWSGRLFSGTLVTGGGKPRGRRRPQNPASRWFSGR